MHDARCGLEPPPSACSPLLLEAATASKGMTAASMGHTPKDDIASMSRARPLAATALATASIGLSTPVVVSQWTTATLSTQELVQ